MELLPQQALSGSVTVIGIIGVALVSAFLPVPMAFDVAIAYILMAKGVPLPYVAAILCTLGIISLYSLAVVGKTISWKIAGATYSAVVLLGIVAGIGLSYAVRAAFLEGFPTLSILITWGWILRAAGIALFGAILGASYPAWMASRKDAVEALSYD